MYQKAGWSCYQNLFWRLKASGFHTAARISITRRAYSDTDFQAPTLEFLIRFVWGRAGERAFVTSSQVALMLLVWGPHLGKHSSSLLG